jgi:hypothetical protein
LPAINHEILQNLENARRKSEMLAGFYSLLAGNTKNLRNMENARRKYKKPEEYGKCS